MHLNCNCEVVPIRLLHRDRNQALLRPYHYTIKSKLKYSPSGNRDPGPLESQGKGKHLYPTAWLMSLQRLHTFKCTSWPQDFHPQVHRKKVPSPLDLAKHKAHPHRSRHEKSMQYKVEVQSIVVVSPA